jgi:hypothetical protein
MQERPRARGKSRRKLAGLNHDSDKQLLDKNQEYQKDIEQIRGETSQTLEEIHNKFQTKIVELKDGSGRQKSFKTLLLSDKARSSAESSPLQIEHQDTTKSVASAIPEPSQVIDKDG